MEKDYLLKKWLLNGLTEEEQRTFDALEDAPLYKAIAASASHFKASHVSSPEAFETLKEKLPKQETAIKKVSWKKTLLQIASVLVIGLAVYYGFFNTQATHIKTVAAQKTTISLPDNSTVLLNTASTITYHEDSWEKERELQLDGEAFIKVAKGKKFDVKTSQGIVSVLGTQFNVKQRGTLFEVSCYEGIVQVSYAKTVKKLLAGDTFRIDAGIEYSGTTNHEAPQWTNNRSSFKSVKFQYVLEELERQYNIKVVYEGDKQTRFFTGAFVQDNLENALQSVTAPLGLTYTFEGTNKVIILD